MIKNKLIEYDGYIFKSTLELYFYYYLEELHEHGFITDFSYEEYTYDLSESISLPYVKRLKTKSKEASEFIVHKCTYTPDFGINWTHKAENTLFLRRDKEVLDVKEIPFRETELFSSISHIEAKPINESKLDSSKDFPIKQKWIFQKYNCYVQKIKPYAADGKNCLFQKTFTPKKVVEAEVYLKNCKHGKKGSSKIRFGTRTIEKYLEEMNNNKQIKTQCI